MIKKLPNYFSIISALIVILIGFLTGKTPYEIIIRLVAVIVIAYFAGFVVQLYLNKNVFPEKEDLESADAGEEESKADDFNSFGAD